MDPKRRKTELDKAIDEQNVEAPIDSHSTRKMDKQDSGETKQSTADMTQFTDAPKMDIDLMCNEDFSEFNDVDETLQEIKRNQDADPIHHYGVANKEDITMRQDGQDSGETKQSTADITQFDAPTVDIDLLCDEDLSEFNSNVDEILQEIKRNKDGNPIDRYGVPIREDITVRLFDSVQTLFVGDLPLLVPIDGWVYVTPDAYRKPWQITCDQFDHSAADYQRQVLPVLSPEYGGGFICYRGFEENHLPSSTYTESLQTGETDRQRALIVDCVTSFAYRRKFDQSTLHLCVCLFDRVVEDQRFAGHTWQRLAILCLVIAAKREEVTSVWSRALAPEFRITSEQLLALERSNIKDVLKMFPIPTIVDFTWFLRTGLQIKERQDHLICYLSDLSLRSSKFVGFRGSLVAASLLLLENVLACKDIWTPDMESHTGYGLHDLKGCVFALRDLHSEASRLTSSVYSTRFGSVTTSAFPDVSDLFLREEDNQGPAA